MPRSRPARTLDGVTSGNPVIRRRQLGLALKQARELAGVTREQAAEMVENSVSYVARLESGGSARLKTTDLRRLMDHYGIWDAGKRRELEQLLADIKQPGWWQPYTSALRPSFSALLGLEAASDTLSTYAAAVVPGLLQTEDYARAVMSARVPAVVPDVIEHRVKVRLERQARLLASDGPRFHAVIDEAALRRRVGGEEVWRAQLVQLAELAAAPNITLQVLPFAVGAPPSVNGSFMLLRLREDRCWVAFVESITGDRYEEGDAADRYRLVFEHLLAAAERPAAFAGFVDTLVKDLTRGIDKPMDEKHPLRSGLRLC